MTDVESVGGKNASLGEMISQLSSTGVRVPTGFATTSLAFRDFSILMMFVLWPKLEKKFVAGLRPHRFRRDSTKKFVPHSKY